jgi:hypothetical protein
MDYKTKYLKYKNKYLQLKKQLGGARVPTTTPSTQSWLYMPLLLLPFNDVVVNFPIQFHNAITEYNTANPDLQIKTIDQIKNELKEKYQTNGVNLNNRESIQHVLNFRYDDSNKLHLTGNDQEKLIDKFELGYTFDILVSIFINKCSNIEFEFRIK